MMAQISYPKSIKSDQKDTYFGITVDDPYRWLEDENSEQTKTWVKEQNKVTFDHLAKIPYRENIKKRLEELWNYEKMGVPFQSGKRLFYFKNTGMQNQSVLYVKNLNDQSEKVLLDPNTLSADGTTSLATYAVSNDDKYFAYAISKGGSDWNEIFIIDIESGKTLKDHIKWVKFSGIAWQSNGFYYSSYDVKDEGKALTTKNEYHKIYFHRLGSDQKEDKLIYEDKKSPLRNFGASVDEDENFLFLSQSEGTSGEALYFKNLKEKNAKFIPIAEGFDSDFSIIKVIDGKFYVLTNDNAPNYRLIQIDSKAPEAANWKTIIPENKDVLQAVVFSNGRFILQYMQDASNRLKIADLKGKIEKEFELPTVGTVSGLNGDKNSSDVYYSFTSFLYPSTIFCYNMNTGNNQVFFRPKVSFNPEEYITEQIFYYSKDSTKIPMFITYKKGMIRNGENPVLLYGYGGFNISLTPGFRLTAVPFLEKGGIYAVANIRGGGEYGKIWHEAGTKLRKQNVFDDFIAAAEYLIANDYTNPNRLAIQGGSNGGLLVGACMTQRPDLFKVALPAVGVMDMLRFQKFTIGWAWTGDYGSSDNEEEFRYLFKYSPLHNIQEGVEYPATLVTTADHDDRVVPAHSYKFIATLQEKHKGDNPVLIRIETMAGHGAGKPTSKQIEEAADILSFMMYHFKMNY